MRCGRVVIASICASIYVLGGCSGSASARPTWPKPRPIQVGDVDGGESLAPRAAARAISAAVEDDRPSERAADKPAVSAAVSAAASPATPAAAATPANPAADEPISAEDIVIEIEGD